MAAIEPLPELADQGYWYLVNTETIERPIGSGRMVMRPAGIPSHHSGWTATYLGDGTVAVRSPVPLLGVTAINASSGQKLALAGEVTRPYGRIGGK